MFTPLYKICELVPLFHIMGVYSAHYELILIKQDICCVLNNKYDTLFVEEGSFTT
jgi:hypothetical protein